MTSNLRNNQLLDDLPNTFGIIDYEIIDYFISLSNLKHSLNHGSSKSRILVTTLKQNVVELMESTHIIPLEMLSDHGSWSLFSQVAFSGKTNEECQKFEEVGRRNVRACLLLSKL